MHAVANDIISTTDGRFGEVLAVEGKNVIVREQIVNVLGLSSSSDGGDTFVIKQSEVASIR